ncbi:UNVERIFIED_CONTAM: hypothetical protein GTU68_054780 [Idotea baltica]|nr:hypothetical protein [Idotea baltica]
MNILVLCTGNSARPIGHKYLLARRGNGKIVSYSAGSQTAGKVHPQSLHLLTAEGYDDANPRSKSWDEFAAEDAPKMGSVISVCGSAATETARAAFQETYGILERRAAYFVNAGISSMSTATLQTHLNANGKLT